MLATIIKIVLALQLFAFVSSNLEQWCIADATMPVSVLQHGLDWACANGAECARIQPGGVCFLPNTLVDHASYAYNSYWKKFRFENGTCDFNSSGIITTLSPSHGVCVFD